MGEVCLSYISGCVLHVCVCSETSSKTTAAALVPQPRQQRGREVSCFETSDFLHVHHAIVEPLVFSAGLGLPLPCSFCLNNLCTYTLLNELAPCFSYIVHWATGEEKRRCDRWQPRSRSRGLTRRPSTNIKGNRKWRRRELFKSRW
jgi:hypothetical protein